MFKEKLIDIETNEIVEFHDEFLKSIVIENCKINIIDFSVAQFHKLVLINNSRINKAILLGTYLFEGLQIQKSTITKEFLFQCGGHNKINFPIQIENTIFKCFADFEDCWFTGKVKLKHVEFQKGSNLLGNKNTPVEVEFERGIDIENVQGDIKINTFKKA